MGCVHLKQRLVTALADLSRTQAELERTKGDVVVDRGVEELDVRILEDQSHLSMKPKSVLTGDNRLDVAAQRHHHPFRWANQPVEQLEQGRLATAVRSEESDLLAPKD